MCNLRSLLSFKIFGYIFLFKGCYAERLYLYGGRIENCELVGASSGLQLWFQVNRVKLTPMEISRAVGARVVKIPLHTRYNSLILRNCKRNFKFPSMER